MFVAVLPETACLVQVVLDGRPLQTGDSHSLAKLGQARSLTTLTPSLEQAGGLQRMTLRGHTGGVQKVLLTPGGIDIITSEHLPPDHYFPAFLFCGSDCWAGWDQAICQKS